MTPARPPIRSMSRPNKAIRNILRPMGKKFGPGVRELKMRWSEIAGPRLSVVCTPVKLSGGKNGQTLTLHTRGSAALLIQAQSNQLLERVNLLAGAGRVTKLRIVQGRIARGVSAEKLQENPATRKTGYSPEQLTALDEQLKGVASPELKAALRELGLGVIARNDRGSSGK